MAETLENRTDHPSFTPLVNVWRSMKRRGVVPEWENFWNFFRWAVEKGWEPKATIRRVDQTKPRGPENCYIDFNDRKTILVERPNIPGGSKNIPCTGCPYEEASGCTKYKTCLRYQSWINNSWEDFRKAAVAKFGKTTID